MAFYRVEPDKTNASTVVHHRNGKNAFYSLWFENFPDSPPGKCENIGNVHGFPIFVRLHPVLHHRKRDLLQIVNFGRNIFGAPLIDVVADICRPIIIKGIGAVGIDENGHFFQRLLNRSIKICKRNVDKA